MQGFTIKLKLLFSANIGLVKRYFKKYDYPSASYKVRGMNHFAVSVTKLSVALLVLLPFFVEEAENAILFP